MQIPILSGIYSDPAGDFRTSLPKNMIPVSKEQGISKGYLRPADGITEFGTGPGTDRGGINWNGILYRVMGTKLVKVAADGIDHHAGRRGHRRHGLHGLRIRPAGHLVRRAALLLGRREH
jgi:hypothetical protein